MNIQTNIDAVERLLNRKQTVPSKLIHDIVTDCKALLALSRSQRSEIERLKAQADAEKQERAS